MSDLLQQVVDLTKTRFGFYHAHIYMIDEIIGDTLVLAAGAGGEAFLAATGAAGLVSTSGSLSLSYTISFLVTMKLKI